MNQRDKDIENAKAYLAHCAHYHPDALAEDSWYSCAKAFLSEVERNEKLEGDNKAMREALEKITHEKTQGTQSKTTGLWCGIVSTEGADLARTTLEGLRVK